MPGGPRRLRARAGRATNRLRWSCVESRGAAEPEPRWDQGPGRGSRCPVRPAHRLRQPGTVRRGGPVVRRRPAPPADRGPTRPQTRVSPAHEGFVLVPPARPSCVGQAVPVKPSGQVCRGQALATSSRGVLAGFQSSHIPVVMGDLCCGEPPCSLHLEFLATCALIEIGNGESRRSRRSSRRSGEAALIVRGVSNGDVPRQLCQADPGSAVHGRLGRHRPRPRPDARPAGRRAALRPPARSRWTGASGRIRRRSPPLPAKTKAVPAPCASLRPRSLVLRAEPP